LQQRGFCAVALAGGSTPRRLYELLAGPPYCQRVDWSRVEVFWGDERAVPPDHEESNYRMARIALLDKVPLRAQQIHRMQGESDLPWAAESYQAEIAKVFGVALDGPPPAFDLILLGMGPDGHTASLFPHTDVLRENVRWVAVNYVPQFDRYRLTLTLPILNRSAAVAFVIAGKAKAAALRAVLSGPQDPERYPSQLIRPAQGELLWLVDCQAAAKLQDLP
jgi:6-phosphogluconolactonase